MCRIGKWFLKKRILYGRILIWSVLKDNVTISLLHYTDDINIFTIRILLYKVYRPEFYNTPVRNEFHYFKRIKLWRLANFLGKKLSFTNISTLTTNINVEIIERKKIEIPFVDISNQMVSLFLWIVRKHILYSKHFPIHNSLCIHP